MHFLILAGYYHEPVVILRWGKNWEKAFIDMVKKSKE